MVGQTKVRSNLASGSRWPLYFMHIQKGYDSLSHFLSSTYRCCDPCLEKREILTRVGWSISIALLSGWYYLRTFVNFFQVRSTQPRNSWCLRDGCVSRSSNKSVHTGRLCTRTRIPRRDYRVARPIMSLLWRIYHFRPVAMAANPPSIRWSFACFLVIVLSQGVQEHHSYGTSIRS